MDDTVKNIEEKRLTSLVTSHGRIRGPQIYYVLWKDHTNLLVCGEETIKTILLQNFVTLFPPPVAKPGPTKFFGTSNTFSIHH
jgi:hypothetical protein